MIEPLDRDVEGQTTAITTFSTVRFWGRAWLPLLFGVVNRLPIATKRLRELSFIDFARWCMIDELPFNGSPQRPGKLRYPHLFFESNFNGSWNEYIDAFSNQLTRGMWSFWGSSYGFPGAKPVEPFKEYIKANEYEVDHYYVAYDAPSTTIQRALALAGTPATPVNPFMAICPIRPEARDELAEYLHSMEPSCLSLLPQTHMGRFVIVDDLRKDPEQPKDDHLDVPYLVFTACHDGPKDDYVNNLSQLPHATSIWGACIGGPGALSPAGIKNYILHNEVKTDVFFAAYHATVDQVRDAIERYPAPDVSWISKTPKVRLHVGRVVRLVADQYTREREKNPGTIAKRDQHADEYGTIHGRLTIRVDEVPKDLRHGLFAKTGSYEIVCRLSPNKATRWPLCPPVGLAMKVLHVPTDDGLVEQDFIFGAKVDRFFCKSAEDAVDLVKARVSAIDGVRYIFPSLNPRRWRLLEARILAIFMTRRVQDLFAGMTYYSQLPIFCGDELVKVCLNTVDVSEFSSAIIRRPDLSARLSQNLRGGGVTASLCLQRMTSEDEPNDPRRRSTGPWERVATAFFPVQQPGDGEDLSFSLAHCHPEHEPYGEVAEVRVAVYEEISRRRHEINTSR